MLHYSLTELLDGQLLIVIRPCSGGRAFRQLQQNSDEVFRLRAGKRLKLASRDNFANLI